MSRFSCSASAWVPRALAWCCVMALGLLGYGLYAFGLPNVGLTILGFYAVLGFGGLLHYTRASMAHHSAMMNATIWAEAVTGTLLLASVVTLQRHRPR